MSPVVLDRLGRHELAALMSHDKQAVPTYLTNLAAFTPTTRVMVALCSDRQYEKKYTYFDNL